MLTLDNADRTAPAAFNDSSRLEIARRIEREAGSAYRINGKEVRARDVQLLFADVSTGARSPALVRQGQIGETHQRQAAGAPPHPRGGGRHRRPAHAPPRGRAQAQGGRSQPRCASRTSSGSSKRSPGPEAPGPPGGEVQERLGRNPEARGGEPVPRLGRGAGHRNQRAPEARRDHTRPRRAHARPLRGEPAARRSRRGIAETARGRNGAGRCRAAPDHRAPVDRGRRGAQQGAARRGGSATCADRPGPNP